MSSLWIWLIALGVASVSPDPVLATALEFSPYQRLSLKEKLEAVRNAVSLLSAKAALLAACSETAAMPQSGDAGEDARIKYREAENQDLRFIKAIDCQLGLEPTFACDGEGLSRPAGEGAGAEPPPAILPSNTAITEPTRPPSEDSARDSGGVHLDLKASWTVSALRNGAEDFLNDTEVIAYLGRKAGEMARDFFKAAANGRLLEPTTKISAEDINEEKLREVILLAGKVLGSLQFSLSPTSLALDAKTHAAAIRRLTTKGKETSVDVARNCRCTSHKGEKSCGEPKSKRCSEAKGKSHFKAGSKCSADSKAKCGGKKNCDEHCPTESGYILNSVQPAPITAAALPFYSPYPVLFQPSMVSLPTHISGVPIIYNLSTMGTAAANTAGATGVPSYQDGAWLYPIAADGNVYQFNSNGVSQGSRLFASNGVGESLYMYNNGGAPPALRSNELLSRLSQTGRSSLLQEVQPLILGPVAALNTQVQQSPLFSSLYRRALGRHFFDADVHQYDELRNFNMTQADLF